MENTEAPAEAPRSLIQSWRQKPWLMLGVGYYFAFSLSVVVNCPSLSIGQEQFYPMLLIRVAFSATVSVSLIVMMFLVRKLDILNSGKWLVAFFVGLTSIGTILLIVSLNYVDSVWLMIASTALIGSGNSVLLLSWGALFQRLSLDRLAGHVTFSCLFAAFACLAFQAFPVQLYFAAIVMLPLASGITLIFCADEQRKADEREVMWKNGLTKILVSCVVMGLTCGLLRVFPIFGHTFSTHSSLVFAIMIAVFLVSLVLITIMGQANPILFLYRFCVPVFIAGYGLLAIGGDVANTLAIACALSGSVMFECLVLLIFPYVAIRAKGSLVHLFGWCAAAQHTGSFAGFVAGELSGINQVTDQAEIALFSLLAVVAFAGLFFFILKELDVVSITEKKAGATVPPAPQPAENRIREVVELYRLSPREAEVLKLLSNGRSLPYIEEELVISHSTARTHVRHIYDKIGVNSRQQLHDLIESADT